jgi:beta-N-acetylhexosaminidase
VLWFSSSILSSVLGLLPALLLRAQEPIPATPTPEDPVEALLQSLTLEQQAGQLFVSWSLARTTGREGQTNHDQMLAWVRDVGLGGVILSLGTTEEAASLVPRLQAAATVPLLLAGDFEGGIWFRLRGGTELGNQMLVGASGSARLAEAMGRVTAEEAKALGFHWVFAPVLDVNSNPDNPIINVRSFGEEPELVARLGAAFARGVRAVGLLPCGKHFPGHGDVATDSHLELPTVPGDRARLDRVELLPFRRLAADGLESVMTGHLAVPGLGEDPSVPATLSRRILSGLLRDELGFSGLVVTDALEMGGVKNAFLPGEVAVRALLAGADVLLMPPDPLAARQAVIDAVTSGRVPKERFEDAVRRILRSKQRVGLLGEGNGKAVNPTWREQIQTPEHLAVAEAIAARGLVLVRDRDAALPLTAGALCVTLLDKDEGPLEAARGEEFVQALGEVVAGEAVRVSPASGGETIAAAAERVAKADRIVLALHAKVREYQGGVGLPPALQPVLQALRAEQQVVVVSFGSPYLVRDLPHADAYVAAFVATPAVERRAALVVRGLVDCTGRLPVSVPGVARPGDGLTQIVGPADAALPETPPEDVDLAQDLPEQLRTFLASAVADGAFPGAVCAVARHGRVVARVAVGSETYDADSRPVDVDTRYDLASLTKVCATTPAILRLVANGTLSLDDPVGKWVEAFRGVGKDAVTIRHLLAHQGGLPAYERFYRTLRGKDTIVAAAAAEGLMSEPGTGVVYSDVGFILLMAVVEAASGEPFERFVAREVFLPFAMTGATFAPTAEPPVAAAPTERGDARGLVAGHVHDENAFAMGGISGHAGLFARADDVLRYGVALLAGGRSLLPRSVVEAATRPSGIGGDTTRGLGFQMLAPGSYGGTDVPAGTFGHTGFTGTSLWCSPRHDLCVVLLTNRVHPTRVNNKITAVRRGVHDLVLGALR